MTISDEAADAWDPAAYEQMCQEAMLDGNEVAEFWGARLMAVIQEVRRLRAERDAYKEALGRLIEAQDHLDYHAVDVRTAENDEERAQMLGPFLDCLAGLETSMAAARAALSAHQEGESRG